MEGNHIEKGRCLRDQPRMTVVPQKPLQHLEDLISHANIEEKWIWELIQNAKDVPNRFGKVKVKLVVRDGSYEFSHNGQPFTSDYIQPLISHDSCKLDSADKREDQTKDKEVVEKMADAVDDQMRQRKSSTVSEVYDPEENVYKTSFICEKMSLNPKGQDLIEKGVRSLLKYGEQSLLFNRKLHKITFEDERERPLLDSFSMTKTPIKKENELEALPIQLNFGENNEKNSFKFFMKDINQLDRNYPCQVFLKEDMSFSRMNQPQIYTFGIISDQNLELSEHFFLIPQKFYIHRKYQHFFPDLPKINENMLRTKIFWRILSCHPFERHTLMLLNLMKALKWKDQLFDYCCCLETFSKCDGFNIIFNDEQEIRKWDPKHIDSIADIIRLGFLKEVNLLFKSCKNVEKFKSGLCQENFDALNVDIYQWIRTVMGMKNSDTNIEYNVSGSGQFESNEKLIQRLRKQRTKQPNLQGNYEYFQPCSETNATKVTYRPKKEESRPIVDPHIPSQTKQRTSKQRNIKQRTSKQ